MRRFVLAGAAVCLLTFAGVALANSRPYGGHADSKLCGAVPELTCVVTFLGKVEHGQVNRVVGFAYAGIPILCPPKGGVGTTIRSPGFPGSMKVGAQRRFSGDFTRGDTSVHIAGQYSKNFKKATGILRVKGEIPGRDYCDTGNLSYLARPNFKK